MSISFRDKILHIDKVLGGVPGLFSRNSAGLVPQAPSGSGTTKFLREDRAWADVAPAQMIAPVESTSTASRAYAIGEQFVYNGILTEATAAISQGATITVGNSGNAKLADCVMDQVIQLKDHLNYKSYTTGIDSAGSSATSMTYYIDVFEKFAILSMAVSTNELGANTWNLIGTLPTGRRPSHDVLFSSASTIWQISTDGIIKVYSPWGKITLTSDRFCITYPI